MESVCSHDVGERSPSHRIPCGGRRPGSRENVALRGMMLERRPWSAHEDGGSIQPSARRDDDEPGVLESARRGGEPSPPSSCGSRRRLEKVLRSGLIDPCNPASPSNGHRRKRWSDRSVARKQRRDRAVVFEVASYRALAAWEGVALKGLLRLAAFAILLRQGEAMAS